MTGINQGRPEMAIGEPIRLGSNNEFEIEQHPVSDRLIIRDTVNGKVAYVRKERGGQIGGDGVLVKALKEGKPVADDGRTHDTIQAAERAASGWVFVPPGTFNESVEINTEGLTLRGSGYNSHVTSSSGNTIDINSDNVSIARLRVSGTFAIRLQNSCSVVNSHTSGNGIMCKGSDNIVNSCTLEGGTFPYKMVQGNTTDRNIISDCTVSNGFDNIIVHGHDAIVANCISIDASNRGIFVDNDSADALIGGNRVQNAGNQGIFLFNAPNCILFNNRISDSGNDIDNASSGTVFDGNLTGASN